LKTVIFLHISRESSDFDEICYAEQMAHSENGKMAEKKSNFTNLKWRTNAMLKIMSKFGESHGNQNHVT